MECPLLYPPSFLRKAGPRPDYYGRHLAWSLTSICLGYLTTVTFLHFPSGASASCEKIMSGRIIFQKPGSIHCTEIGCNIFFSDLLHLPTNSNINSYVDDTQLFLHFYVFISLFLLLITSFSLEMLATLL